MKKLFTLMLMLFTVIGIQAATPDNLYIFGNAPFGDWVYNPIASGKATQMTKSGNKFTWSGTISSTCYFAFLTQDGSSWDDLNNNYRLSSTTQAISLNTEYALSSGDRSMKLNPGDYTITVDYSSGSPKLKVTGYAPEVVITGYSVIGAKELFGGNGWDTDLDMTESSTGVWTATLSGVALVAGDYEYKARANKEWGVAEYPESGNNTLTISEAGTYNVVFTLTLASSTLTAFPTKVGDETPGVTDLYLVGEFNDWTAQDANYLFTKRADGKFEFTMTGYVANQMFKFVDNNGTWYGSATGANEGLGQDNHENIALATGGMDDNFYASEDGSFTFVVDIDNMTFDVGPAGEEIVEAPEHIYILGGIQGWDPSAGLEMSRTKVEDGKYIYEYTGSFPDENEGNTYFSFTTALASASDAWEEIAGKRYGAYNADEAITADNTDPYDLKAGENAFVMPAGTYRVEINWKEEGPDICMWVHTEAAPEITDLYMIGSFNDWSQDTKVQMTNNGDGTFTVEQALDAEDTFKFIDNLGNWYGGNADGENFWITADAHENIDLNNTATGKDFYMPTAGTYTFNVNINELKLDVAGEFSGGEVNVPEHFYILGMLSEYGWAPNQGVEMTKKENTFTWSGSVTQDNSTFSFTTLLATNDGDNGGWDEIATSRYGAEADATVVTPGNTYNVIYGNNDFAFSLNSGTYTLTVTFNGGSITLDVAGEADQPVADVPDNFYILGNDPFGGWQPNNAVAMTKKDNTFTWSGTISETAWFSFTSLLATNDGDNGGWDEIVTSRYGAESNGLPVSAGNAYSVIYGNNENAFMIDPGEYTFTVTFNSGSITLDVIGEGGSEDPFVLPDCATYIEGKQFAYFEKPAAWGSNVYAYTWQDGGAAPVAMQRMSAAWPGDVCEYVGLAENGNSVYRYAVDDADFNMIIFNDGEGNQTGNFNFTNGGYYRLDGLKAVIDSTTGITGIEADVREGKTKAYNLQGMEVRELGRGIYIINGKKVLRK